VYAPQGGPGGPAWVARSRSRLWTKPMRGSDDGVSRWPMGTLPLAGRGWWRSGPSRSHRHGRRKWVEWARRGGLDQGEGRIGCFGAEPCTDATSAPSASRWATSGASCSPRGWGATLLGQRLSDERGLVASGTDAYIDAGEAPNQASRVVVLRRGSLRRTGSKKSLG